MCYAYDDIDVLEGVSLDVEVGEHLAVIGPSGAGKTTLGRLIAGVDRPRAGRVTVGGVNVADLPPEQLRQHVVLVTQEHHVFADPLRDNLTLAAPHATDDDLFAALRVVGADWVSDLPQGLDTDLSIHRIGGAQAQHVALARVVLANPHTLVLDEATALLDPNAARHTERALAATAEGRAPSSPWRTDFTPLTMPTGSPSWSTEKSPRSAAMTSSLRLRPLMQASRLAWTGRSFKPQPPAEAGEPD